MGGVGGWVVKGGSRNTLIKEVKFFYLFFLLIIDSSDVA